MFCPQLLLLFTFSLLLAPAYPNSEVCCPSSSPHLSKAGSNDPLAPELAGCALMETPSDVT